jgi:hypothetical protein
VPTRQGLVLRLKLHLGIRNNHDLLQSCGYQNDRRSGLIRANQVNDSYVKSFSIGKRFLTRAGKIRFSDHFSRNLSLNAFSTARIGCLGGLSEAVGMALIAMLQTPMILARGIA